PRTPGTANAGRPLRRSCAQSCVRARSRSAYGSGSAIAAMPARFAASPAEPRSAAAPNRIAPVLSPPASAIHVPVLPKRWNTGPIASRPSGAPSPLAVSTAVITFGRSVTGGRDDPDRQRYEQDAGRGEPDRLKPVEQLHDDDRSEHRSDAEPGEDPPRDVRVAVVARERKQRNRDRERVARAVEYHQGQRDRAEQPVAREVAHTREHAAALVVR